MKKRMGNERTWTLLLGAVLACAACAGEEEKSANRRAAEPEPGTSSRTLALSAETVTTDGCVAPAPADFADDAFRQTWNRGGAGEKYWGPAMTGMVWEHYGDKYRLVQYFQKTRMEINNPSGDKSSIWYVTNGLLVSEMVRGQIQVGDAQWENRDHEHNQPQPSDIQIAGDPNLVPGSEPYNSSPVYASLTSVLGPEADRTGQQISRRLYRNGQTENVTGAPGATYGGQENRHNVATLFKDYRNALDTSMGTIDAGLYLIGRAITDPYWVRVPVGGTDQWVLVQAFERRVLTYTPSNSEAWRIEMGNVGLHYMRWRYNNNAIIEDQRRGDFVTVKDGHFLLDGKPFRHVGVNMPELVYYTAEQVTANLSALADLHIRHIRVFLPNDTYDTNGTNGVIERLRRLLDRAGPLGVKVTVVLAQNYYQRVWPQPSQEEQGPFPATTSGQPRFFPRGDGNAFWCYPDNGPPHEGCGTHGEGNLLTTSWFGGGYTNVYRNYVRDVVTSLRTSSAIFSWEIANEVKDPSFTEVDNQKNFVKFYEDMAQFIKDKDPDHLVAAGLLNTFHPGLFSVPGASSQYLCNSSPCPELFYGNPNIDYVSIHTYNNDSSGADRDLAKRLHKPWIIEEAGFCVTLPFSDDDSCARENKPEWEDPQHEMERLFGEAYNTSSTYSNAADAVMVWGVQFGTQRADRRYGPSEQEQVKPGQLDKYKEMWTRWGAALSTCNTGSQGALLVTSPGNGQRLEAGSSQSITWTASDPSITEVAIQVHNGTSWSTVANAPNTGTYSWLVPSVTTDRAYVRVSDVRDYTKADMSSAFTIAQPIPQVPLRVVLPTAETIFPVGRRIELKFQAPQGRIGVFYQSSPSDPWPQHLIGYVDVAQDDPNAIYLLYWNNVPLSPTRQYRIVLWIEGSDGDTAAYSPFAWTSQVLLPVAPSQVTASATSSTSMRVQWQDNSGDETSFLIERRKQSEATFTAAGSVGANVTSFAATGLEPGVSYCFRVSATNAYGTAPSGESCGATHSNVASFVSQSVPATMVGGQKYTVSITMRNDGTATWNRDGATPYRLGSQPQDTQLWVATRAAPSVATVAPGALATFSFQVTAPSTPGTYDFQWRMVQELVQWFGPVTPKIAVTVTKGVSPLYSGYYLRNWPTGDGLATQWSELFVNNPSDAPALVTIRVHKQTGGDHAVVQLTIPAHGMWNSYGQPAWRDIPFTNPNVDSTKSASIGWLEVGADRPVIATQRFTFRTGNTYDSPMTLVQDGALVPETSRTLYAPFYLKSWSTGYSGKTQWSNLTLINPGCCATANVTIRVYKFDGTGLLGSITQSIAPGAQLGTYGLAAWLNLPDANPHVGWVEVSSDQPIFGTNRVTVRNGSTYNAPIALFQDEAMSGVTDTRLGTSQLWKNWQWPSSGTDRREWSSLVLVNPNASTVTARVRIYASSGVEIKNFTKPIPARAWWNSYNDTDWNQVPDGARGWIAVEVEPTPMPYPQSPLPALPIFGNHRKSVVESSIYTGSSLVDLDDEPLTRPASTSYASTYLKNWPAGGSNTQWSSLIVSNPEPSTSTTLKLNVYGMDGVLLKTLSKTLLPHGWWNAYCDTDWLSVPATASFTSTGPASLGWIELSATIASNPSVAVPVRATNRVTLNAGTTCGAPIVHFHDVTAVTKQP